VALDELRQVILEKNMKNMKRVAKTVVGTLGFVVLAALNAQFSVAADSGWLVGANIGQSRAEIDDARISAMLQGQGLDSTISDDDTDIAFKIFGGYKFNKYFALEGGYFNLGQFGYTATTTPAGTLTGKIKLQGLNLDAVGILPITKKFSAFGRVGVNYAEAKDNFASTGAVPTPTDPSPSKTDTNYKVGLGLQYDFTRHVGLRGEWERYRINDAVGNDGDINMYSVGVVVMFGGSKAAARERVRVFVPVREQKQYCSVLDFQFEINQEDIQREEKEKFAVVATFLKKYPDTTAVIEGHTDNVGTNEDNMKLSKERALSVVAYLVDIHKIAPSRLTAVGYGETRPIADNDTEDGKRQNRRVGAVIACATDFEGLKVVPARITMAMEIDFDPYKDNIEPQYRDELRKVADFMKANPSVTATVEGHDAKFAGNVEKTPELSMQISQRRAQNVVNYLADNLGIARSRLSAVGFGQTRRVDYGTTLEGQQENRRVNIIFNYARPKAR
jgi:OmpA-OmpF porin, OOP family